MRPWFLTLLFCLPASAQDTTLINWNTYHRFHHGKRAEEGAKWLAKHKPDIVALQELTNTSEALLSEWARGWRHKHTTMNKESGYALGLTSRSELEDIARVEKGFHHGYLHARTAGVDIFVVHFWPDKLHEPRQILKEAQELVEAGREVLVVGDFNNHAKQDLDWLAERPHLKRKFEGKEDFDTRMTDLFLEAGFVDLLFVHDPKARYSYGSPALIPEWAANMEEVQKRRQRIDFAFASPSLAARVTRALILTDDEHEGQLSDHYPLLITWRNR